MSAESQAYSVLSAASGVTALVSTRIYPDFTPEDVALPSIAIARAGTEYTTTIHSDVPVGVDVTLEAWCMASTRKGAEDLADAVVAALGADAFLIQDRSPQFDAESKVFATVLTVVYHEL